MIFHDPYAGHRKWWDPEWKPDGDATSWTDWDYLLAKTLQHIEDYTDTQSGQLVWIDQSGDVWWEVKSRFSGHDAAIDKAREGRDLKPGESLYAVPVFKDPDNKPTLSSWVKDLEEGKADLRPSAVRESRPPTPEEVAALKARRTRTIDDEVLD